MRSFFREKAFIRSMGFRLESSAAEQQKISRKVFSFRFFLQFSSCYHIADAIQREMFRFL